MEYILAKMYWFITAFMKIVQLKYNFVLKIFKAVFSVHIVTFIYSNFVTLFSVYNYFHFWHEFYTYWFFSHLQLTYGQYLYTTFNYCTYRSPLILFLWLFHWITYFCIKLFIAQILHCKSLFPCFFSAALCTPSESTLILSIFSMRAA